MRPVVDGHPPVHLQKSTQPGSVQTVRDSKMDAASLSVPQKCMLFLRFVASDTAYRQVFGCLRRLTNTSDRITDLGHSAVSASLSRLDAGSESLRTKHCPSDCECVKAAPLELSFRPPLYTSDSRLVGCPLLDQSAPRQVGQGRAHSPNHAYWRDGASSSLADCVCHGLERHEGVTGRVLDVALVELPLLMEGSIGKEQGTIHCSSGSAKASQRFQTGMAGEGWYVSRPSGR